VSSKFEEVHGRKLKAEGRLALRMAS